MFLKSPSKPKERANPRITLLLLQGLTQLNLWPRQGPLDLWLRTGGKGGGATETYLPNKKQLTVFLVQTVQKALCDVAEVESHIAEKEQ